MTLDFYPGWWRRMAKMYLFWLDLPDKDAERFIDTLPEVEQDRFNSFLLIISTKTPTKALRKLEADVKNMGLEFVNALIGKLPRVELEKLIKAGLKRGKLIDNLSKMDVEELRNLVLLCSLPKGFLVHQVFVEGLDPEREQCLLS